MKLHLNSPCEDCPFLKAGGIRLTPDRAAEIAFTHLDSQGDRFMCHKTVHSPTPTQELHCAGALIFALKNNVVTQAMRMGERLGLYDFDALTGQDRVFDSLDEMLKANGI